LGYPHEAVAGCCSDVCPTVDPAPGSKKRRAGHTELSGSGRYHPAVAPSASKRLSPACLRPVARPLPQPRQPTQRPQTPQPPQPSGDGERAGQEEQFGLEQIQLGWFGNWGVTAEAAQFDFLATLAPGPPPLGPTTTGRRLSRMELVYCRMCSPEGRRVSGGSREAVEDRV
jgi:hypothetical protein